MFKNHEARQRQKKYDSYNNKKSVYVLTIISL